VAQAEPRRWQKSPPVENRRVAVGSSARSKSTPLRLPPPFRPGFGKTGQILVTPKSLQRTERQRQGPARAKLLLFLPGSVEHQVIGIDAAEACGHLPAWRGAERRLIGCGTDRVRYDCLGCCTRPSATGYGAERNSGVALAVPAEKTSAHYRTWQRGKQAAYFHVRKLGYTKFAEPPVSRCWAEMDLIGMIRRCSVLCGGQHADHARREAGGSPAVDRRKRRQIAAVAREHLRRFPLSCESVSIR
jgi:hypothetical protein